MIVESLVVGPFGVNVYLVYPGPGCDAVVIDPGDDPREILSLVSRRRLNITHIINTHGHGDHIGANADVKRAFPAARICIHSRDAQMLVDPAANLSREFGLDIVSPPADIILDGNTEIVAAGITFAIGHTPGHTAGSICLVQRLSPAAAFTGDTLFAGSVGRCDMPGGNARLLMSSITDRLMCLPDETIVYPGHGASTSIGTERRHNPFIGRGL
jgi:glyoxylase-like metal-dependent hydrolase (beta-lactamase superfamily II)